jgi:acyl carrier protein
MDISRDEILQVLYQSIRELNEQRSKDQQLECSPGTALGEKAGLDSLGFVNLVAIVEEKCQDRFGRSVVLSGTGSDANARDPFENVSSLAEFIELALADRLSAWR